MLKHELSENENTGAQWARQVTKVTIWVSKPGKAAKASDFQNAIDTIPMPPHVIPLMGGCPRVWPPSFSEAIVCDWNTEPDEVKE